MFKSFFQKRRQIKAQAGQLYAFITDLARTPTFYTELKVPDTVDGRFELLVLHAFFVMHSLKGGGRHAVRLSQALFDTMFYDLDRMLREGGVGDMGIPKHVKRMQKGFYGRVVAYQKALDGAGTDGALKNALRRNLYGTTAIDEPTLEIMARYVERKYKWFQVFPLDEICQTPDSDLETRPAVEGDHERKVA